MAIGFGRAIAAALAGTTKGLAEAAEKEDEKRDELTKITLAQKIKNIEKAQELSRKRDEEIAAETEAVDALMGFKIQGQQVSRAQATRAYRMYGNNAPEILRQGLIQFEDTGFIEEVKTPARMGAVEETEALIADGGGLFGKGRGESVSRDLKNALSAMGYDPSGVEIAQKAKVVGAQVVSGPGAMKRDSEYFYSDIPGHTMVEKITITDPTDPTRVTTQFLSLDGSDLTDRVNVGTTKLSKSADAIEPGFKAFKLAFRIKDDGSGVDALPYQIGIKADGTKFMPDANGDYTTQVTDSSIVSLTASELEAIGGVDGLQNQFGLLDKDAKKALKEFNIAAEGFETFANVMDRQVTLLNTEGFGDNLTTTVGGFNSFVNRVNTEFQVGLRIVDNAINIRDEEGGSIIPEIEQKFERLTAQRNRDIETLKTTRDIATAIRVFEANQILLAYNYAKATGDTRISNQDFDNFIKLVEAPSAEGTKALYRQRIRDAADAVEAKRKSLYTFARESRGEEGVSYVENLIGEERSASVIQSRVATSYIAQEEDLPSADAAVDQSERSGRIAKEQGFREELVLINEKTNQITNSGDPEAIEVRAIVDQNGNIVMGSDGSPIFDRNAEKGYLESMIPRMINQGLIEVQ